VSFDTTVLYVVDLERLFPCGVMSLMRLNFLATYLRNLFLRDTTPVVLVVGTRFAPVLNCSHPFIPSGFLKLLALRQSDRYDQKGNDRQHTRV